MAAIGEPAPVHPHLFRHARVRQIVRMTRSLPLAQRQAGWSRLQMAYLTVGDVEARQLMRRGTGNAHVRLSMRDGQLPLGRARRAFLR